MNNIFPQVWPVSSAEVFQSEVVVVWNNLAWLDLLCEFLLPRDIPFVSCVSQEMILESVVRPFNFSFFFGIWSPLFSVPAVTSPRCGDTDVLVWDAAVWEPRDQTLLGCFPPQSAARSYILGSPLLSLVG